MNEYTYDQIEVGHAESFSKVITVDMENAFRNITEDVNPLHYDDAFATSLGGSYKQHVTFGMLTASFYSTLAGVYMPGKYSLIHSIDSISFKKPVYAGDTLTVTGVVESKQDDLRLIQVAVKIINQENKVVSKCNMKIIVQK